MNHDGYDDVNREGHEEIEDADVGTSCVGRVPRSGPGTADGPGNEVAS